MFGIQIPTALALWISLKSIKEYQTVVTLCHDWTLGLLDPFGLGLRSFAISLVFTTILDINVNLGL